MQNIPIILASNSPARRELLSSIYIDPIIIPADVDETEFARELPNEVAIRLSKAKAIKTAEGVECGYIIGADTVAAVGRRIMPKALTSAMVADCMSLYSGRRHRIYTGVHIIKKNTDGRMESRSRLVQTIVGFKRMTDQEIEHYANCGEGIGKAGGYAVQGSVQGLISFISGSFSNIIGLPLFETRNMLISLGYKHGNNI